jgi:hypothetical protein
VASTTKRFKRLLKGKLSGDLRITGRVSLAEFIDDGLEVPVRNQGGCAKLWVPPA